LFFIWILKNNIQLFFSIDWVWIQTHFLTFAVTLFLIPSVYRLLKLIFNESSDIEINDDGIVLKNIITQKKEIISRSKIKGYRIERYKWNIIKIAWIKSIWEYESKALVIYSNYRAVKHFKSLNYFGINRFVKELDMFNYTVLMSKKRYFDKGDYLSL